MADNIRKIINHEFVIMENCPLCNSIKIVNLYKGDKDLKLENLFICTTSDYGFSRIVSKCMECGVIFLHPFPEKEFTKKMYKKYVDTTYLKEEKARRTVFQRDMLQIIKMKQKKDGLLLDMGASVGLFLDVARRNGYDVQGTELSKWAVEKAKSKYSLDIENIDIEETHLSHECYDIITMNSIIEHLFYPINAIKKCYNALKPGGILFLVTPNPGSFLARFLRSNWWSYREAHLFLFTPQTLKKMLLGIGFTVKSVAAYSRTFSVKYWIEKIKGFNELFASILDKICRMLKITNKKITLKLRDEFSIIVLKDESKSKSFPAERRKKVIVIMPAYNAEKTLVKTYEDLPKDFVDEIILVDDASEDKTVDIAKRLGIRTFVHKENLGYGANQKTCYREALKHKGEIIVMVHPDYQYDPTLLPEIIEPIIKGKADVVLGSRMLKKGRALKGGMPFYKYVGNKVLTAIENLVLFLNLSEYHTGYRAFSSKVLLRVPFMNNSDKFVFDTDIIIQIRVAGFRIKEVPIPTRYFKEASSVDFKQSIFYGVRILRRLFEFLIWTNFSIRLFKFREFPK